jgi:ABC-type phosphate transport system substrate-binding protein
MIHPRFPFILGIMILTAAHTYAQGGGYKIVVHSSNPLTSVKKDEIARIFSKKSTKFSDGRKALPVDLPVDSSVRDSFSKGVLGKPASAMNSYWQQQIFSGKDVPPPLKREDAVISFVLSNEYAIAYISSGADTSGLKVITVVD